MLSDSLGKLALRIAYHSYMKQENKERPLFSCNGVGFDLSSRLVAKQVFSALQSLTSVFGMGTGGPSALEKPTSLGVFPKLFVSALTYLPGSSPSKYFRHCRA